MTHVFLVCGDGGWEPDPVLSIWDTREGAEAEVVRLGYQAHGTYTTGLAEIKEIPLNVSGNEAL